MFMRQWRAAALTLVAIAGLMIEGGCQSQRLSRERDELYSQNQELQDQLTRMRAERDAALQAQAFRAQQPVEPAPMPQPAPMPMDSGFGGIAGVEVEQGFGQVRVKVPGDVLFASGKADLTAASKSTLQQVARVIQREHPNSRIIVEGHTDTDPIRKSKWPSNQALSEARAQAVADYLSQQGVSRSRIETVGYGSSQPRETKARSRRVEIVVLQ